MMNHHIGAALADEHRKTLLAQAEAAGLVRKARLHRPTATRSRAAVSAGIVAIAALLGGTAAAVVAASADAQSAVRFDATPPGPQYDAQLANKYAGTQPAPKYDPAQLASKYQGTPPTPGYEDIQLTVMFEDAAPGPNYDA